MTQRSKSVLIIVLIAIILAVGVLAWLSKAGKLKIGADVATTRTSEGTIPINYQKIIEVTTDKNIIINSDMEWTVANNILYLAKLKNPNSTDMFLSAYDLKTGQIITIPSWSDANQIFSLLSMNTYNNQPYLFTNMTGKGINVFKLENNTWNQAGEGSGETSYTMTQSTFNNAEDGKMLFWEIPPSSQLPDLTTTRFVEFNFATGKWIKLPEEYYRVPYGSLAVLQNKNLFAFGGSVKNNNPSISGGINNVIMLKSFINIEPSSPDAAITYYPKTLYNHYESNTSIVKNGNKVFLFTKGNQAEVYNLDASYGSIFAQAITYPPVESPKWIKASNIDNKVYLLILSGDKLILYEVQAGNTTPNPTTSSTPTTSLPTPTTTTTTTTAMPTNASPTITSLTKTWGATRIGMAMRYRITANWVGTDTEDKANLQYHYKIDNGAWSAWSKQTSVNTDYLYPNTNHTITVQAKDSAGALSPETTK